MSRNRVIYQSEALYVSSGITSTATGQHRQLDRVQSANYSFSIARQDINQYGELARIDSIVIEAPTVNLDFSYYLTDGSNERAMGFYVQTGAASSGSFASGHMVSTNSGQNYFIVTAAEGYDHNYNSGAVGLTNTKSMIGIGNGFLSNYKLDVAVGSLPTVSVTVEGSNILSSGITTSAGAGLVGQNPAIKPDTGESYASTGINLPSGASNLGNSLISALRPGDVTLSFTSATASGAIADLGNLTPADGFHIQSASLDIPLSRAPIQRLGSRFPFARPIEFPVVNTLTVNAILNEVTAENLATILDANPSSDITLTIKKPGTAVNAVVYVMKGSKLSSENFTSSIGSNKTVDLTFTCQIGGPQDTNNGIFMSGIGSGPIWF